MLRGEPTTTTVRTAYLSETRHPKQRGLGLTSREAIDETNRLSVDEGTEEPSSGPSTHDHLENSLNDSACPEVNHDTVSP